MDKASKMDPRSISVEAFSYELPQERIAAFPLSQRDESQLLVFKEGKIADTKYYEISNFLKEGSLLVFNNTKVVRARLHFKTSSGATIEIFCLEPEDKKTEVNLAMQATGKTRWKCLVGELRKWKEEFIHLSIPDANATIALSAKLIRKEADAFIVELSWNPARLTFAELLEKSGKIPLPPYIKRALNEEDKTRYQTIYAQHDGSVAAPTAGLHFTQRVFNQLSQKNIDVAYVTLHIGAGTFKPVKSPTVGDHEMHSEQIVVEKEFIQRLLQSIDKDIVAVGTTSLRTLESLYWLGLKMHLGLYSPNDEIAIRQWDPYELNPVLTIHEALVAILDFMESNQQEVLLTRTQLLIVPGYVWKVVNTLATNFHQSQSTLIMLVAAFIGEDWKNIYNHALTHNYRFLSYGDGSLLFREV